MQQKELVEYITRSLVDNPDQVEVRETEGEQGTVLELTVFQDDLGKVIGKRGKIARAIRQLMKTAANNCGKKVTVNIKDEIQDAE